MAKVVYKGKIDTFLLLFENLNFKAALTGRPWRVRVESRHSEDILLGHLYFKLAYDEEWMENLQEVEDKRGDYSDDGNYQRR